MPVPSAQKSVSSGAGMGHGWGRGETPQETGSVLALRGQFSGGVTGTRPSTIFPGLVL